MAAIRERCEDCPGRSSARPNTVEVLGEFEYLRGVPMARAVIEEALTTGKIDRHMTSPTYRAQLQSEKPSVSTKKTRTVESGYVSVRPIP